MQIIKAEIIPVELKLKQPVRLANHPLINQVTSIFIRADTLDGRTAWGCSVVHPDLTGESIENAVNACIIAAEKVVDLHPTDIEFSLNELKPLTSTSRAATCAFDLLFHDLLGLAAGMPLFKILGGYRYKIQTSATVSLSELHESVELAKQLAAMGFRILKVKGGEDPDKDVRRIEAINRALPDHVLRLDADGGYDIQTALDVARALEKTIEFIEQPTPASDQLSLQKVTQNSPVPVLADQSVTGPSSALELVAGRKVDGMSIKMATCGGFRSAQQIDSISRAADITTMISCIIEPALQISAGLHLALSSPNVGYADLDGHLGLQFDPTRPGFRLEDGWLIASDAPGLGCIAVL